MTTPTPPTPTPVTTTETPACTGLNTLGAYRLLRQILLAAEAHPETRGLGLRLYAGQRGAYGLYLQLDGQPVQLTVLPRQHTDLTLAELGITPRLPFPVIG